MFFYRERKPLKKKKKKMGREKVRGGGGGGGGGVQTPTPSPYISCCMMPEIQYLSKPSPLHHACSQLYMCIGLECSYKGAPGAPVTPPPFVTAHN